MSIDPALTQQLTDWRRHLHAHPELSRAEAETAAFVCARLADWGIPFQSGIGGHGIVATLSRGSSNRGVGLRGDMDALPIDEQTGLAHASLRPGVMHACGHDGHTTSLLGAARLLQQDTAWSGTIHLVFQPAEEGAGGAQAMLDDGLLQRFPMERIFAYHNWPELAAGHIAVRSGPVMASASRVAFTMLGTAGHAGLPHLTHDPVLASAHALIALQSVVSREISPTDSAVLSFCVMEAGAATNQIPDRATFRGTYRAHRPEVRDAMAAAITRIVRGTAATFGMRASVEIAHTTPPVVNPASEAEIVARTAQGLGFPVHQDLPPSLVAEDFGAYQQHIPGAFLWVGNGESAGLHSPDYDFNDLILPVAAQTLAAIAKKALAE